VVNTARRWLTATAATAAVIGAVVATTSIGSRATTRHAPRMQLGLDSFVAYHCQGVAAYEHDALIQADDDRALHANAIAFAFPIYMPSLTSDVVAPRLQCDSTRFETPPVSLLSMLVGVAHRVGLAVLLRPLIVLTSPGRVGHQKGWRGSIAPSDLNVWFANYWASLRPYLAMAQADHVEHVAIASELDSVAAAPQWTALIAKARGVYAGDLVFDYSWNDSTPKSWRPHTSHAVDAYPNLPDGAADQTSPQLVAQWDRLLATNADYAVPDLSTVAIDEVGILAQVGAYVDPAASALPLATHPFKQSIQVRWFAAACAFAKEHHLRGLYFWGSWLPRNDGSLAKVPSPSRPSDIQPAAQAAIRKCFA
jgi:hypothetical protein